MLDSPAAPPPLSDLAEHVRLEGRTKDAHDEDWTYAFDLGPRLEAAQSTLDDPRVVVAAVRFASGQGEAGVLSRADTALCAQTFARAGAGACVLLAYCPLDDSDSGPRAVARLAVCSGANARMTAEFDPELPAPSARTGIERALALLAQSAPLSPERLLAPLEAAPLRQQFYEEVSAWTQRQAKEKPRIAREATLRHLIRAMFAWILREKGDIPGALFEQAFAATTLADINAYHADVLRFLFHQRLNVEASRRTPHSSAEIERAMEEAPFLNGSLFQEQEGDLDLNIPADEYWRAGDETPGLFTIFSRYHWTVDEHRPGESEQTLDPELLSNLFERLILPMESDEPLSRQPQGTYYTPADVASEMAKDALAAAVRGAAPSAVGPDDLLALFGDRSAPLPAMSLQAKERLARRIHELRIFDPAAGSGVFLFECLAALRVALKKLEPREPDPTERVIREQLFGQDIHPLAAHIARLRLYIALKAADRGSGNSAPLPNLDARIVCADTLETSADPNWRPDATGQFDTSRQDLRDALLTVAENRARWLDAHSEEAKQNVLNADSDRREQLHKLLEAIGIRELGAELRKFANTPILTPPSRTNTQSAARVDARLLFYEAEWRGFDIVIGNPPYEKLSASVDADRKQALAERKQYKTTNCGNLYTLFCEAALALAKPEGGVITLIVPLSLAFGQAQRALRRVFENRCASISLRHYDNSPDTVFHPSPMVTSPENSQRATIVVGVTGRESDASIAATGLYRWGSDERAEVLQLRQSTLIPARLPAPHNHLSNQWARIPTREAFQFVQTALKQARTVSSYEAKQGVGLSYPLTARYFISILPLKSVSPRSEKAFYLVDDSAARLAMAALNGHAAYGWWRIFGDGFHLKAGEVTSLPIPDAWAANPQPAIDLGRRFADAIPNCVFVTRMNGTLWRNVDFHTHAPELVAEADRLYIEALGLPLEPLLAHLKIMRSNSSWDFPAGGEPWGA